MAGFAFPRGDGTMDRCPSVSAVKGDVTAAAHDKRIEFVMKAASDALVNDLT